MTDIWDEPFAKYIQPEPNSGCWLWTGALVRDGYAVRRQNQHTLRVHRELYARFKGPIPPGMDLDHLCRVRSCVNYEHLEIVTRRQNIRRGAGHGGQLSKGFRRDTPRKLLARIRSTNKRHRTHRSHAHPLQKPFL